MRWLKQNQAHLVVLERARLENTNKRNRLPSKTSILGVFIAFWGLAWLVSMVVYSLRSIVHSGPSRTHVQDNHDHDELRHSSPIFRDLKRPLSAGRCTFPKDTQYMDGFLVGHCVSKQACEHRETLHEAEEACLTQPTCGGVTFVPWEDRYELRDSTVKKESFDGQQTYLKICEESDQTRGLGHDNNTN